MIYKILSAVLGVCVLLAGTLFLYEKSARKLERTIFRNQIAKLEDVVEETESAYSVRGIQLQQLGTENAELQAIIDDRDEEILALGELSLQWKSLYFKIKNAKQTVVPPVTKENNVVEASCQECLASHRLRVDFEHEEDAIKIKGFTLTSPPEAELSLSRTRALKLNLILAKSDDDLFRVYVDPNDSDVEIADLKLQVDPEIMKNAWYEKIGVGADFNIGQDGVVSGVRVFYDILENLYIGPNVVVQFDGVRVNVYYGAVVGWYPFRGM